MFTDDEAPEIDRAQYETDDGPCLDAYRNGVILRIDDTMDDDRWTEFASAAFSHGVRSTLSLPLRVKTTSSAPSTCTRARRTPSQTTSRWRRSSSRTQPRRFASAQAYSAAQALNEQLRTALASRAVIEQAKGVLMRDHECDAEHAFEMLKHASQHTNRKVRDVAVAIVNDAINGGKRSQSA